MVVNPLLEMLDPKVLGGILGALISGAAAGSIWVARAVYKHRKSIARGAAAVLADDEKSEDNGVQGTTVESAILQYLRAQERRDIAERQAREAREVAYRVEENRRWERVETLTLQMRDQAAALQTIVAAIQNSASYQDNAHQWHAKEIAEVKTNQVRLSEWLRDNRPSQQRGGSAQ